MVAGERVEAVFALRADVDIVGALILSNLQEMLFPFSYKKKKKVEESIWFEEPKV